jgi:hypothetical protein
MYETNELILGKFTTLHRSDNNITITSGKRHTIAQEDCGGKLKHLQLVSEALPKGYPEYRVQIKADNEIVFDESFADVLRYYENYNEDIYAHSGIYDQLVIRDIFFERQLKIVLTVNQSGGLTFHRIITKIFKRVNG